jgi:hypothetical protein
MSTANTIRTASMNRMSTPKPIPVRACLRVWADPVP